MPLRSATAATRATSPAGWGENTRNSARGIQAAGIVGFINGNEKVSADIRDCVNTGKVRSESGRTAGICGFASYCDFDGNENLGTVEGAGRCWAASSPLSSGGP